MGRSRGGLSKKIHMLCGLLGKPLKFILTGGQVHDVTQAEDLLKDRQSDYVLADKGYDSDDLVQQIEERGSQAVIPGRENRRVVRKYSKKIYRERNVIERAFNKLKHFRRVATRYEKTATNFMAFLHLAGTMLWLR